MALTTIILSKSITRIDGNSVSSSKMASFPAAFAGLDSFKLTGHCKPGKIAKYQQIAEAAGYAITETVWMQSAGFEGQNADVISFNLIFSK